MFFYLYLIALLPVMMVGVGGGRVPLSGGGGADAERASGRIAHGSTSSPVIYTAVLNNKKKTSGYTT